METFPIFSPRAAFIGEMRDEVENMPGDLTPSKIVHDEKRLDRVLKENRGLVMRCKELEIKLESRYLCERFVTIESQAENG